MASAISLSTVWIELVGIIESGLKPDPARVFAFAEHLRDRLEAAGEVRLAERIKKITERATRPAGAVYLLGTKAVDIEAQLDLFAFMAS